MGSKTCRRASAGRLFCLGVGDGEAAGDWLERGKGEFGLEGLPRGERREIVQRGGAEEGEAAGYCYERDIGELGLEELPLGAPRESVLREAKGDGGGGRRLF